MYDGLEIFWELDGRLKSSGLMDASDHINLSLVGDRSQKDRIIQYALPHSKYCLIYNGELTAYEWPALLYSAQDCENSDAVFYAHTKGSSNQSRQDVPPNIQRNLRIWRDLMSYHCFNHWALCNRIVTGGHDACGALYSPGNGIDVLPHFAGNFFWTNGRHLKRLPKDVDRGNRNKCETWLGRGNFYNLYSAPVEHQNDYYGFDGTENPFGDYKKCLQ